VLSARTQIVAVKLDELYSSDAFITEHAKVQQQPAEPDCHLERVVLGLMFWSYSTHLANFGTASLALVTCSLATNPNFAESLGQGVAITLPIFLRYVEFGVVHEQ
jgi:hypothetical protein